MYKYVTRIAVSIFKTFIMMISIALTLCLALTVTALPWQKQGQYLSPMPRLPPRDNLLPQRPDGKIIGGTESTPGQFPYQAALYIDEKWFCGGSLIDVEWVLSAGHCTFQSNSVVAVLGDFSLSETEENEQTIASQEIFTHEKFSPFKVENDIGLVHLEGPVEITDFVAVIPLTTEAPEDGEETIISGWGITSDSSEYLAPTLQFADVIVADYSTCMNYYNSGYPESQICVDTSNGHSSCSGDSGGPMTPKDKSVLYGATSYGSSKGCEVGAPVVYTKVSYYLSWIENISGLTPVDA